MSQFQLNPITEYTLNKRVSVRSQRGYRGKINTLKLWFLEKESRHHFLDDNNEIKIPPELPFVIISDLFSWLSTNTELPRTKRSKRATLQDDHLNIAPANEIETDSEDEQEPDESKNDMLENVVASTAAQEALQKVQETIDSFACNEITVAVSTMQGYKSALKFFYWHKARITMHPDIDAFLENFIDGYKKIIADKKARGVMDVREGRMPYSFTGYRHFSGVLMKLKPQGKKYPFKESVFAWCFEVNAWNLISRSCNVAGLIFPMMGWAEDCMVIRVPKHKGDQTGESIGKDKHVYANPFMPEICPILATAVALLCIDRKRGDYRLFTSSTSDQFCNILSTVLNDTKLVPVDVNLGAARQYLGSQSNRKGAATYLQNLSPCFSAPNINLRAGWSVGTVQDRYIFAGTGGDQLVGRGAAGLEINSRKFSVLPPHFTKIGVEIGRKIGWGEIIPDFEDLPACFQQATIHLIASAVHHTPFLRSELDRHHPLFKKRLFTKSIILDGVRYMNAYEVLKDHVVTGYDRCSDCGMTSTGIPTHILLSNQIYDLKCEIQRQNERIKELQHTQQQTLDRCQEVILGEIRRLPDLLRDNLLENFQFENVAPVNIRDIRRLIEDNNTMLLRQIGDQIQKITTLVGMGNTNGEQNPNSEDASDRNVMPRESPVFNSFYWGGKHRMVPADFKFPDVSVKNMWDFWYFGDSGSKIQPYKKLGEGHLDDLQTKLDKVNFSRAKKVMGMLEDVISNQQLLPSTVSKISALDTRAADEVFEKAFPSVLQELYPNGKCKRGHEVMYATLANRKYTKKLKPNSTEPISSEQDGSGLPNTAVPNSTPTGAHAEGIEDPTEFSTGSAQPSAKPPGIIRNRDQFWSDEFERMFGHK